MRIYKLTMADFHGHGDYLVGLFMDEPSGVELLFAMQHPQDTSPAPLRGSEMETIIEGLLSTGRGSSGAWQYFLDVVKI